MGEGKKGARAPRMRLSAEQRDRFLKVLEQTGNRRFAAAAIGVEPRLMDQRRRFDKLLDEGWEAALAEAERRLAPATGPFDCAGAGRMNVVRRGAGGRTQIVAAGAKRWSRPLEDRFLAILGMCGNVRAAARAIGFTESSVWQRRRKWLDFAQRMEETLEDAEVRLEFRLATLGNDLDAASLEEEGAATSAGESSEGQVSVEPDPFDPDIALRFLKWREDKRRGLQCEGKRWQRPRTLEEVGESILRKMDAIERYEQDEKLEEGWTRDNEGNMIPPGWVGADGRALPPPDRGDSAE